MIFAYIALFILFLFDCKPQFTKYQTLNYDFMNRNETLAIKGIFVILVFFRHFRSYVDMDYGFMNHLFVLIDSRSSQLIVTMFFFYSGYGIFEQLKNKQIEYSKNFFIHRFLPTYANFAVCVFIYFILCIFQKNHFSINEILLSFLGWENYFGNSNWFMFVTFCLYLLVIPCFFIKTKNILKNLIAFTVGCAILCIILYIFKSHFWYNTLLCFPLGMYFSYSKEYFFSFFENKKNNYIIFFVECFILFIIAFFVIETVSFLFIFKALLFTVFVILILMKFQLKQSTILASLGRHVFSFYILQRISFRIFSELNLDKNIYLFFLFSLVSTIFISYLYDFLYAKTFSNFFHKVEKKR